MPSPVKRGKYRRKEGAWWNKKKHYRMSKHSVSSDRARKATRGTRKQVHRYPQAYD